MFVCGHVHFGKLILFELTYIMILFALLLSLFDASGLRCYVHYLGLKDQLLTLGNS